MTAPLAVPIPEACRLIGVGRSTLYKLIDSGHIKPRKIGRRTLLIIEELDALVKNLPAGRLSDIASTSDRE